MPVIKQSTDYVTAGKVGQALACDYRFVFLMRDGDERHVR